MNDRIRELWKQAGGHYNSGNQHTWPQYTIDNPEKFAELIVRECMNAIYNIDDLGGYHFKAATAVKEHFGVEE